MVPVSFRWSDVGSWGNLDEVAVKNKAGNILNGRVVDFDSAGVERRLNYDQLFTWRDQLVPMLRIARARRDAPLWRRGLAVAGQAAPQEVGQITLTDFVNPAGLFAKGENLYLESGASGPAQAGTPGQAGLGLLQQGALESSNVNTVEELVAMIETQRAYEINAKAISTTDQMLAYLNNKL